MKPCLFAKKGVGAEYTVVTADDRGECSSVGGAMWVSNTSPERLELGFRKERPSCDKF